MATNLFSNTALVTKYAIAELLNNLQLAAKVDRQLDTNGLFSEKVGDTIKVRRRVYYAATSGETITSGQTSALEQGTVDVKLDTWEKVVVQVTSKQETLNIEDANRDIIKPAMQELAQKVESKLASLYDEVYNFVGTPGTSPGTFLAVAAAKQKLNELGVPMDQRRCAFYDPEASTALADGLKAVFPQDIAKKAIEYASIGMYAGFDIYENQSLKLHTVGVATGTPLVNGADQNVAHSAALTTWTQSLITDGWTNSQTGILKEGDVFTIADVYSVNRRTRESTGQLAQFVVRADADSGASTGPSTLTISPPIITSGAFQTVDAAPANNAAITVKTGTGGSSYRQNLAFHENAFTLAVAQIDTPSDGVTSYRESLKGVSIRVTKQFDITLNATIMRFDILFGVKAQNPDFAVRTTG